MISRARFHGRSMLVSVSDSVTVHPAHARVICVAMSGNSKTVTLNTPSHFKAGETHCWLVNLGPRAFDVADSRGSGSPPIFPVLGNLAVGSIMRCFMFTDPATGNLVWRAHSKPILT